MITVFHHTDADGYCSAAVAMEALPGCRLIPIDHGQEIIVPEGTETTYFIDYCPKYDALVKLTGKIVIIDHHLSAHRDLEGRLPANVTYVFDNERSGCGLAADHFGVKRCDFINYVEDADLFRFALSDSNEVSYGFKLLPKDAELYHQLLKDGSVTKFIEEGRVIKRLIANEFEKHRDHAHEIVLHGRRVWAMNQISFSSEFGNWLNLEAMQKGLFCGGLYSDVGDGTVRYSLRSAGDADVSALAAEFGGGGHKHAAGFSAPVGADLT